MTTSINKTELKTGCYVLYRYTCVKDSATYDTPRGLNVMREDEKEPWPVCSPQVYSKFED